MQLNFLEEMSEYKMLSQQVKQILDMTHNMRRNIFAQLNDHDKIFVKIQEQLDHLHQKERDREIVQIK